MKNNKMKIKYLFITGIILILLSNCKKEPTLLSDTGTLPIIKITIVVIRYIFFEISQNEIISQKMNNPILTSKSIG